MMHRNQSVSSHTFAMVPRADIPRSAFNIERGYKTTFDAGKLIPVFCEEVLPGDSMSVKMTAFARLATPIFPLMDNMHLDSFFFFVPNRLVWQNWQRFMGEQDSPGDSTSYVVPVVDSAVGGFLSGSLADYFGLPTAGQTGIGEIVSVSALPFRAYNQIYNQWFRDQNLIDSVPVNIDDGPDAITDYPVLVRGKRHDYFTSCLPFPYKSSAAITIPIGTSAPVLTGQTNNLSFNNYSMTLRDAITGAPPVNSRVLGTSVTSTLSEAAAGATPTGNGLAPGNLYADLSLATGATINQLRQAFQIQRLLERDARGGTRYIELIKAHFGVTSPDARLQRPEYLGGGSSPLVLNPVAQTSASGLTGGTSPLANLAAVGTVLSHGHGFSQSFVEHGYVIGIVCARADLSYQQGIRRHWTRAFKYDYYWPAFAHLGEQAVLRQELYATGNFALDNTVFGYQERWAEYRYSPSEITGLFRSYASGTLDAWHLAQMFGSAPLLNEDFINENPPVSRVLAVGAGANGKQFIFDSFFKIRMVRPMPLYSVPGLIDHF